MTVYLDHAATTPARPEAVAAYAAALATVGNPSSVHAAGRGAARVLEEARERVAPALGCDPVEVVFTSGGTESVNLAVKGLWWVRQADRPRPRIVVPRGEHHATVDAVEWLERTEGAVVDWVPLDVDGRVRLDALAEALREPDDVALVTFLWANNEVGTLQPVAEVVALAGRAGVPVHSDAVAAFGQVPVDFGASGLSALSVSAHKVGGTVGTGALVLARGATVEALVHGGGQQRKVRSGTQDVAGAVAFATAVELLHGVGGEQGALDERYDEDDLRDGHDLRDPRDGHVLRDPRDGHDLHDPRDGHDLHDPRDGHDLRALRDRLVAGVRELVPTAVLRGDPVDRLPGNAHFTVPGCEGDSLLFLLDAAGVCVSTGSACQAGVTEPSHVLLAMGLSEDEARGAIRVTLGHDSTDADVDAFLAALPDAVARATRAGLAARTPTLGRR